MHWQQRVGHSRQQLLDDCLAPGLHRVELRPRLARANEAFSSCEPMTARARRDLRPMLGQTRRECCHEPNMAVFEDNEKVEKGHQFAGLLNGRYWARTSDPQLVDSEQRSRQFTGTRLERMVSGISRQAKT